MKRFLASLLAVAMILSLGVFPAVALSDGDTADVVLTITPNITSAEAGDDAISVTYTIKITPKDSTIKVGAFACTLNPTDGMTLSEKKLAAAEKNKGGDGYWVATKALQRSEDEETGAITGYFEKLEYTAASKYLAANGGTNEYCLSTEADVMTIRATIAAGQTGSYTLGALDFKVADPLGYEIANTKVVATPVVITGKATPVATPVSVTGLTQPAKGAAPVATAAVALPVGLTVNSLSWSPAVSSTFAPSTAYTATLGYTVADGYCLPEIPTVATPTGAASASIDVVNQTITVAFPATADKDAQTISAENVTAVYGNTNAKVNADLTTGDGALSYAIKEGAAADVVDVNSTTGALTVRKAGATTVVITAAETDDYAQTTKKVTVTVSPKSITPTVTVNIPTAGYTYDGTSKTPGVTVKDGTTALSVDTDYTLSYTNNINACTNTAKVTVSAAANSNYTWTAVEETFSIGKGEQTISGGDFSLRVGSSVALSEKFGAPGSLSYRLVAGTGNGTCSENNILTGTQIGTLTLSVIAAATDNYNESTKAATVTITAKDAQTISAENVTAVYGNTNAKVNADLTIGDGALSYAVKEGAAADVVDVNSTTGALTIKKAGTTTVVITAAETEQCAMQTAEVTVTVAPKEIAAPAADTMVYTYNGKEQTYQIAASDAYTVTGNVQANANETGYPVAVVLKDKDNTVWADTKDTIDKSFTFQIRKADITISADNKTAYVKDAVPELSYTIKGLAASDTLQKEPTVAYEATPDMTKAGTVAILVSGAEAPVGDNYNDIVYVNGKLTITNRSSGGGGAVSSTYTITVKDSKNGTVTADRKTASSGSTVTLTVSPNQGWTLETLSVTNSSGKEIDLTIVKVGEKYTFKMPASNVTVKATFMEDNTILNYFVDVPTNSYYYDAVLWAVDKGITQGTDDSHFSPDGICTRAQAVTFLWRAAGSPAPKSGTMPFTDVPSGAYYETAVLWAVEQGITKGTSDTTFSPDATCSRGQIVTFLYRSEQLNGNGMQDAWSFKNPFTDVDADSYYSEPVMWAVANGVTTGTSDTTFSPDDNCTRAQIVTFIYRCMK